LLWYLKQLGYHSIFGHFRILKQLDPVMTKSNPDSYHNPVLANVPGHRLLLSQNKKSIREV